MKTLKILIPIIFIIYLITSCTVTNNMYVNNASPQKKGEYEGYFGLGTGFQAKIDSTPDDSVIYYSDQIKQTVILYVGGQYGLTDKINVRAAVHLPKIIGGLGIRAGIQYSLFDNESTFNAAAGGDFGFVISRDSIKFGSTRFGFENAKYANGSVSADFFIPLTYKPKDNIFISLTPRYSFNSLAIRQRLYEKSSKSHKISYPALTLGFKISDFYFEASAAYYGSKVFPLAGIAVIF